MKEKERHFTPKKSEAQLVYGLRPVIEALEAAQQVDKIYLHRDLKNEQVLHLKKLASDLQVPVIQVPSEKMDRLTRKNHQGVVAFMASISFASLDNIVTELFNEGKNPFILVLDRITDVRNFGAIARTASCTGIHAIVIPAKETAQLGPDAMKTSAGALHHIPVCREPNLKAAVDYLRKSGLQIICCTEKGEDSIYQPDYSLPTTIIMGSEEDGISFELLRQADFEVRIPIGGPIESLNVSVATGVILFEAVRQKVMPKS